MYNISRTIENGIERIVYLPKKRRYETPIVLQHGMWHGAWCWKQWQELFAEWGWESHAHSLPGHAGSPEQRPIRWCTLGYYFKFLLAEVNRQSRPPIIMGHSMGGALTQWYFKHEGDLPAAVLVAPWPSHSTFVHTLSSFVIDFWRALLSSITLTATPMVRNPRRAFRMFLTEGALYEPEEIFEKLGPESSLVLFQYNPPFWSPVAQTKTPLLWLAGEKDLLISESAERRSAAYYGAKYSVIGGAGHNLMLERSYRETAKSVHNWLVEQGIQ
jgi:pimeloyl-ACP methyl ester carboxylesterase